MLPVRNQANFTISKKPSQDFQSFHSCTSTAGNYQIKHTHTNTNEQL